MNNETQTISKKPRILWIDCAKFIGIIFVVFAHLIVVKGQGSAITRGLVYSLHMPLFFILSFITVSLSDSLDVFKKKTKRRAKHLLIPFAIFLLIDILLRIFYTHEDITTFEFYKNFIFNRLIGLEGVGYISAASAWFFIALFVGQTLFDGLHLLVKTDSMMFVVSTLLTIAGVIFGQLGTVLPFDLDMVFSSFIFFFIGYKFKYFNFEKSPLIGFAICAAIWLATFFLIFFQDKTLLSYYEIWPRRYPLFPVSFICAIFGSMMVMYLSVIISKAKPIGKTFAYLGSFNVYYIVIHAIHQNFFLNNNTIFPEMDYYVRNLIFLAFGICICILFILFVKGIKKLSHKKQIP